MRRGPAVVVVVAVLGVLGGCSSKHQAAPRATTSTTAPAPSTTTTSTNQPTTTTTTLMAAPALPAEADLARVITEIESAPSSANGWQQQVIYRALAADPALAARVTAKLSGRARAAAEANVEAGAELRALTKPRTALPDWRIVEPAPAAELVADYKAAQEATGVPWPYLAAVHLVETKLGRVRGTSTAGAQGPMQFLPSTWKAYGGGGDINDTRDAIFGAARLLKANGGPGDMAKALYAYNHSDHYVKAVTLYAKVMADDEAAFNGYYGWQVYYRMVDRDRVLLPGYPDRAAL